MPSPYRPIRIAALAMLLAVCVAAPSVARHRHHATSTEPGVFDYYVLSLSWSPAFCLGTPNSAECTGARRFGFIVHGLWPQFESGYPENCAAGGDVPESVVEQIADIMPARKLVLHEWSTHGTCSGLDTATYFGTIRRAFTAEIIPAPLKAPTQAVTQSPQAIVAAFVAANPSLTAQSVAVLCSSQGTPRLSEVHICLDKNLSPRACSAQVLNAGCKAAAILIPPIR